MSATVNHTDRESTCLIDRLEKSFDLHVAWPSINHLPSDLKSTKPLLSETGQENLLHDCPQADDAQWPGSNSEHELSGVKDSPPLYCRPPPLHPESPVSLVQEGSQAEREKKALTLSSSVGTEVYQQVFSGKCLSPCHQQ